MKKLALLTCLLFFKHVYSQEKINYVDRDTIAEKISTYSKTGYFEKALEYVNLLSRNDSTYLALLVSKSYYLIHLKKFEEAIKVTGEGFQFGYTDSRSHFYQNKGVALLRSEKYQEAVDVYDEAIKEYPKNHELFL